MLIKTVVHLSGYGILGRVQPGDHLPRLRVHHTAGRRVVSHHSLDHCGKLVLIEIVVYLSRYGVLGRVQPGDHRPCPAWWPPAPSPCPSHSRPPCCIPPQPRSLWKLVLIKTVVHLSGYGVLGRVPAWWPPAPSPCPSRNRPPCCIPPQPRSLWKLVLIKIVVYLSGYWVLGRVQPGDHLPRLRVHHTAGRRVVSHHSLQIMYVIIRKACENQCCGTPKRWDDKFIGNNAAFINITLVKN